jgi:hypothetical protein
MRIPERVRAVPAGGWLAGAVLVGLVVLVWHDWQSTAGDEDSWLDPGQPALQLDAPSAHIPSIRPRQRCYPDTVASWGDSTIGDC